MILSGVDSADFNFLLNVLGLSRGNLSTHTDRLARCGYVEIEKGFNGKIPQTTYRITDAGRSSLERYWFQLDQIRKLP